MARYLVFTGVPSATALLHTPADRDLFKWQTFTSTAATASIIPPPTLPPSTLAIANRRISKIYENVIFAEPSERELSQYLEPDEDEAARLGKPSEDMANCVGRH